MRFVFIDGIWVGVHTAAAPTAEEWQTHCLNIEQVRNDTRGVLVYTEGGGPSTGQRKEMRAALQGLAPPPSAILTDSALVRGIVTALNWTFGGEKIAAFPPGALPRALHYLERNGAAPKHGAITRALGVLANELSIELPRMGSESPPPA
ncbi:MAG TPA: hypothetical protein VJR89_31490 [Polyangiales bacterium]|nr:hypothetical protein [Polyangiales bacterium]